jgi:hypothetical protein
MVVKIGHVDRSDQSKLGEAENLALLPWRRRLPRFVRFVHTFRILSMEVTWTAQPDSPAANVGIRASCKLHRFFQLLHIQIPGGFNRILVHLYRQGTDLPDSLLALENRD